MNRQWRDQDPMADEAGRSGELERAAGPERDSELERNAMAERDAMAERELPRNPDARADSLRSAGLEPVSSAPDMAGVDVEPARAGNDPRVGAAVVGGALGAVAGALVGGPAGAIVGGAVGAAGGAVVAQSNEPSDDKVVDIDHPDMSGQLRRPSDDDLDRRR